MDIWTAATGVAALLTPIVVQLLKTDLPIFKYIPAQKYPVEFSILVSVIATVWSRWNVLMHLDWHNAGILVDNFAIILLGAALLYRTVINNWPVIKDTEGTK